MKKINKNEKGMALILVLIILLVGALVITPLLSYMITGLKAVETHEGLTLRFYAADAGVEDAIWKLKNHQVPETMPYQLTVNSTDVTVYIDTQWVLEGLETPAHGTTPHVELVALGRPIDLDAGQYEVEITCDLTGEYDRHGVVKVNRIGVFLPGIFKYIGPSSGVTTDDPVPIKIRNGNAWIWDLKPPLEFPNKELTTKSLFFYITPTGKDPPGDFAWVKTQSHDIYLSWDADFENSLITSIATDGKTGRQTEVLAYVYTEPNGTGIITWKTSIK